MKLHKSKDDLEGIILRVSERENIRPDILEKDYYVTLLLKELSHNQEQWKAYFKGGTALYKALSSINRFSEDIDLTVCIENCTKTQQRVRLNKAATGYGSLERLNEDKENVNMKGSITSIYGYEPLFHDFLYEDPLQRFGRVKIEATSFTVSEPVEIMEMSPIIYMKATLEEREILKQFNVVPFGIFTIKLERIFIDKVFAAEFYYQRYKASESREEKRKFAFDVSKHIYDLIILYNHDRIKLLVSNSLKCKMLIALKRKEEENRKGGIQQELRIKDFSYLKDALFDEKLETEFHNMQDIYVFRDIDKVTLSDARLVMEAIVLIEE